MGWTSNGPLLDSQQQQQQQQQDIGHFSKASRRAVE
jgi:hypothetical protein